jgi:hypothetical protein
MAESKQELWFTRAETFPGFRPLTWQAKVLIGFYVFLVVLAIPIYVTTNLVMMVVVVAFYTIVFGGVVYVKSDIRPPEPPPEGR